ncbi:MAG: histidine phosphatase family protein [Bacillota bacterium]
MRLIYLVRHGEIENENNRRRYVGQLDLPLSKLGVSQADSLGQRLQKEEIAGIFCSDLIRSIKTADIIAQYMGLKPQILKELREINLGKWEGLYFDEVRRNTPEEFEKRGRCLEDYRHPGGETFREFSIRVNNIFKQILLNSSRNIIIVSHAGVNRMILCNILGITVNNQFKLKQDYGCLNIIRATKKGFLVTMLNNSMLNNS